MSDLPNNLVNIKFLTIKQLKQEFVKRKIKGRSGKRLEELRDILRSKGVEYVNIPRLPIVVPAGERPGLSKLNPDILEYISGFLNLRDLVSLRFASKDLRSSIRTDREDLLKYLSFAAKNSTTRFECIRKKTYSLYLKDMMDHSRTNHTPITKEIFEPIFSYTISFDMLYTKPYRNSIPNLTMTTINRMPVNTVRKTASSLMINLEKSKSKKATQELRKTVFETNSELVEELTRMRPFLDLLLQPNIKNDNMWLNQLEVLRKQFKPYKC